MNKKGVTLITLTLAVVVIAILAGAVVFNAGGSIGKAERAKFAEEVQLIEDKIEEYYVFSGEYPLKASPVYSKDQIVALNEQGNGSKLENEIIANKDQNSQFYLIDYDKIKVRLESIGLVDTPDDIYVFSKETNTVYYVKGFESEGEIYFSLINISNLNKIN